MTFTPMYPRTASPQGVPGYLTSVASRLKFLLLPASAVIPALSSGNIRSLVVFFRETNSVPASLFIPLLLRGPSSFGVPAL